MSKLLIFGLSGQVGDALLPMLLESACEVTAVSRTARTARKNLAWLRSGFPDFSAPPEKYDAIVSLGPLDAFAAWLASADADADTDKIIALGSTSIVSKKNSPDPAERKLSQTLARSEEVLLRYAEKQSASLIILRPTLIYGAGRDQSISRWLAIARRLKFVVLPTRAGGLRQPVHVADIAAAVMKSISVAGNVHWTLDLPGGEILGFDEMLLRSLKVHAPKIKVLRIPNTLCRFLFRFAAIAGLGRGLGSGFFARLSEDRVFDVAPARIALDYRPRPFSP